MTEISKKLYYLNLRVEGFCTWMYLDIDGAVTTGIGNLIDSITAACRLPWLRCDGSKATAPEVIGAWHLVKARQDLREHGGGRFAVLTSIRLSEEFVKQFHETEVERMTEVLIGEFPLFSTWPESVQVATLSMAWAMGPAFYLKYPKWRKAAHASDWKTCAAECEISEKGNPGVAPRNDANRELFELARDRS